MDKAAARERAMLKVAKAIAQVEAEMEPFQVKLAKLRMEFRALTRGGASPLPDDEDLREDEEEDERERERERAAARPSSSRALAPTKVAPQQRPEWQSLNDRILAYFATNPGEHDVDAIAEGARGLNRQTLRATLAALYKEGKLTRVSKGHYTAAASGRPTLVVAARAARGHGS